MRAAALKGLAAIVLLFLLALAVVPVPSPPFERDYSPVVVDGEGRILRVFLNQRQQWHLPPRADQQTPANLVRAVLCFEDRRFYHHPGVDPRALVRAAIQNAMAGGKVSGASTLTMQVARLMQPKPRTVTNKLLEALQALRLELRYSKEQILRLYLDHAPYGSNIVGVEAASWRYFGKPAQKLTWAQAAALAVLPNAPGLVSPVADRSALKVRRDRLLQALADQGHLDAEACLLAQSEPVPSGTRPFPLHAPHLCRSLAERRDGWIASTLDLPVQQRVEDLVRRHSRHLHTLGIRNAAALVVDNDSRQVRAYVGSQDFSDREAQGQVDGIVAPRSSGSLLKPLLYAAAMDEGLALPQTLLHDVPTYYGAFAPSNADRSYRGMVPAGEALVQSLNVPAVRLLNAYGVFSFHALLQTAGVSTLFRTPDQYGLPLVIGGAEVTLWDMAALYCSLANQGRYAPLRVVGPAAAGNPGAQVVSPGASHLVLEVLREVQRPGAEYYWRQYQNQWPLAWKTGTSYGRRDAWAVGANPEWTIAVWAGNFDGEGNADLSGARSAGPLLFDIFHSLPRDSGRRWFREPAGELKYLSLCRETGFAAGPHCPASVEALGPQHMKPLRVDPYHRTIHVTLDGSHKVCSLCWESDNHSPRKRLVLPPVATEIMRRQGRTLEVVPPHRSECPSVKGSDPLRISYPLAGARLWLPRDLDGGFERLVMQASHRDGHEPLFWYLDHRYLGQTRSEHAVAVRVASGWHELQVVDGSGQGDNSRFHVSRRD